MNIAAIGGGNKTPILESISAELSSENVVIIPSACSTPASYDKKVPACLRSFGELGLKAQVLHKYNEKPSHSKIATLLGEASLAYVIGGNTPYMAEQLETHGTGIALSYQRDRGDFWLTGTSAGALLSFEKGMSCPAKKPAEEEWDYTYVDGLRFIRASATVHADKVDPHPTRQDTRTRFDHFERNMPGSLGFGIGENAALVLSHGHKLSIARSEPEAAVHMVDFIDVYTDVRDVGLLNEIYLKHLLNK